MTRAPRASAQPPSPRSAISPPDEEGAGAGLKRAGASGATWQGLAYLSGKVVIALTTVLLARLLTPQEFGLVALATVFILFADVVSDAGVAQALVYLDRSVHVVRAAALCAVVSGAGLLGAGLLAAPAVAAFFDEPDVVPLFRLLSVSLLLTALAALPEALLRKQLKFRRIALAAAVRAVVLGAVAVVLAFLGHGPWSLAWGTVAGAAAYLVTAAAVLPDRPDVRLWLVRRRDLRAVLRYGLPVAGAMLLSKLIFDVDYLVIGRQLDSEALGYYTMAFRLPELAIINAFFVISSVTFPLYARARHEPMRLRRGYLLSMRVQAVYGVAAGVGIAVTAQVLVPVVLGARWEPAVSPLVALGLYAALRSLGAGANDVYKALGRPMLSLWMSLIRLAVLVPALLVAVRWGITGVAWGQVATSAVFVVIMQALALRVLGLRWRDLAVAVTPALAAASGVLVTALPVVLWLPAPDWLRLVVAVIAAVIAAAVCVRLFAPSLVVEFTGLVRRRRA